jgi:radical SAM superfamily enzyme YgiQ (UPF0313 family)
MLIYPANHQKKVDGTIALPGSDMPVSLLYLSGAIRHLCDEIIVFDFNLIGNNFDLLNTILEEKAPSIVGINCLFSGNFLDVLHISEKVKIKFPSTKVIIGGLHPTLWASQIMEHCPSIDAIMLGEAENSFPLLLEQYFNAHQDKLNLAALDSVVVRLGGGIITKPKQCYIEDLDTLPMPGYEYLDISKYAVSGTDKWFNPKNIHISALQAPLLTSRSCPNRCNFCAMCLVMGEKFRYRSAKHVFNEILHLYNTYGITYFRIADDNFTFNKKRTLEICDLIVKNNLKIGLDFHNGLMIRTLDNEVIEALCNAGGMKFGLAIESGSEFIRNKILHKNCSREKILDVVAELRKYSPIISAFFIIGFPEETEETLNDTLSLIKDLNVDKISLSKLNPFPGTLLFEQCLRDKLFINDFEMGSLWKGDTFWATGSIKDGNGASEFVLKPYNLSVERLKSLDMELQSIIQRKNESWINHLKNGELFDRG